MPFPLRQWKTASGDDAAAGALARSLDLPSAMARLLTARGLRAPAAAEKFLHPRLSEMSDPFELPGMTEAVDRIQKAIQTKEPLALFGDYDVDGVTGVALLATVLRRFGVEPACFLPSRFDDGYGLTTTALRRCLETHRPALLLTVDCGTNSAAQVDEARQAGVDVVVTDHHEPSGDLARPTALVNPVMGGTPATRDLAGVGVAFKLCHALVKRALKEGWPNAARIDLREWLDLVAVGTVADVVPLRGENRILVRHGLGYLEQTRRVGLEALCEVSGLDTEINCYHIGFVLGPRLNAAGRLASAEDALTLLITEDRDHAWALAQRLDQANRERKRIEDAIREEAEAELDVHFDGERDFGLVAARRGWHVGTIGIVASRLCARYGRPTVVVAIDDEGRGRGSARSVEAVDVVGVLNRCAPLLLTYGGHQMAAGLSLAEENIAEFRRQFNALCAGKLQGADLRPVQRVDAWVNLGEADRDLYTAMANLNPVGLGNPAPAWGARAVRPVGPPTRVGKDGAHLKMTLAAGATQIEAIAFGMGKNDLPSGPLDVVFKLEEDSYQGRRKLVLHIQDLAPSGRMA